MKLDKNQIVDYFNKSMRGEKSAFATLLCEDEQKPAEDPKADPKDAPEPPKTEPEKVVPITEAAKKDDMLPPAPELGGKKETGKMEVTVPDPEKPEDAGKDAQDKADEVLAKIDLKKMDNKAKVELISSIINVLQDSCDTDEEFSDYMNELVDMIDSYKFDQEPGKEEPGKETPPVEETTPKGEKTKVPKNKTQEPPTQIDETPPVISGVEK